MEVTRLNPVSLRGLRMLTRMRMVKVGAKRQVLKLWLMFTLNQREWDKARLQEEGLPKPPLKQRL